MLGPGVPKPIWKPLTHEAHVVRRNGIDFPQSSSVHTLAGLHGIIRPTGCTLSDIMGTKHWNEHRLIIHGMVKYPDVHDGGVDALP